MARTSEGPDGYILDLAKKSQAFRALEGAANARLTLHAGFTAVRDVESEGSGYADVALRDAIDQGLVEGPRMHVATRAIAAVGQYNSFGVSPDLRDFPTGAQMISGPEEARRAVREQIGYGADLIKVYADWRTPTLTVEETRVVVEEAHKLKRKVAAHATTAEGIFNALTAGVDSIEHGHAADRKDLELMKEKGVFLVPTVGGIDASYARRLKTFTPEERKSWDGYLQKIQESVQLAKSLGVKIASGYDAGSAERQGKNAEELVSLTRRGLTPLEAIRAATTTAAPVWRTNLLDTFIELILKGQEDFTIYVNVRDFSSFLAEGLEHRLDWAAREDIKAILSNEAFVESLWKTVTSRKIQYRMQISFIRDRQSMIQNGVPERLLPLTEELQQRLKEVSSPQPRVSESDPT